MPNLYEWFLILFQPMPEDSLIAMLSILDFPAQTMLLCLYGFFAFLVMLLARQVAVTYRNAARYGELTTQILLGSGLLIGGALSFGHILSIGEITAGTTAEGFYYVGPVRIPGFGLLHRAIMPLDVSAIDLFLIEGQFLYQVKRSFLFWEEHARGLYVYPLLILMLIAPILRTYTAPLAVGIMGAAVVPALISAFLAAGPASLAALIVFLAFATGAVGAGWRYLRGRE